MKSMRSIFCLLLAAALCLSAAIGCAETLTLPANLRAIEAEAFCGDTSLDEVVLPEGLETIGSRAFAGSSVSVINLPSSITFIDDDAFDNCDAEFDAVEGSYAYDWAVENGYIDAPAGNVTPASSFNYTVADGEVTIDKFIGEEIDVIIPARIEGYPVTRIGDKTFYGCTNIVAIRIPDTIISIGKSAFYNCKSITDISIPDSVLYIGDNAFCGCATLKNINIPNSITSIGKYLFDGCIELTDIDIPITITSIDDYAFSGCSSLTNMTIPNSVTSIGSGVFRYCDSLTNVTIPNSITSIGDEFFDGCSSLTSIDIPTSVTSIGNYAFSDCDCLTDVSIPDSVTSIGWSAFAYSDNLTDIKLSNSVTKIEYGTFECCYSLRNITLPDSVTRIGDNAFSECNSLASITLPDSVTVIGDQSFYNCIRMANIYIPASVEDIGLDAFDNCKVLTIYGVSDSYAQIYAEDYEIPFESVDSPEDMPTPPLVIIPTPDPDANPMDDFDYSIVDGAVTIDRYIGTDSDVVIPEIINGYPVDRIGEEAFYDCECDITSVKLPDSLTSIGEWAFYNCSSLTSLILPDSMISIEECSFNSCTGLHSIYIPVSVNDIAEDTFIGCILKIYGVSDSYAQRYAKETTIGFKSVESPDDMPTIVPMPDPESTPIENFDFALYDSGEEIEVEVQGYFGDETDIIIPEIVNGYPVTRISDCFSYSLTRIKLPNSLKSIGASAFSDCSSLTSIIFSDSLISIGDSAFYKCESLTDIVLPDSVTSIGDYAFDQCESLTDIVLPDSVTSIGYGVFYHCRKLKNVFIPDSVTSISGAFSGCSSLVSIDIPSSVTNISGAFSDCSSLMNINIPDSVTNINGAFDGCSSLLSIDIPNSVTSIGYHTFSECFNLINIDISDSVTSIGDYAFFGCSSLMSIEIPDSVTSIGDYAFFGCNSLMSIEIPDSVTSIRNSAFIDCSDLTIYGISGSYAETYATRNGIPFIAGEMPNVFATISDFTLNSTSTEITVPVGSTLTFGGTVHAGDDAQLVAVQASVFDAADHTKGVKFDREDNIDAASFSLSAFDDIVVGQTYSDENQTLTMEAGKSYDVMLYATNTNGCGFESIPAIRVNVTEEDTGDEEEHDWYAVVIDEEGNDLTATGIQLGYAGGEQTFYVRTNNGDLTAWCEDDFPFSLTPPTVELQDDGTYLMTYTLTAQEDTTGMAKEAVLYFCLRDENGIAIENSPLAQVTIEQEGNPTLPVIYNITDSAGNDLTTTPLAIDYTGACMTDVIVHSNCAAITAWFNTVTTIDFGAPVTTLLEDGTIQLVFSNVTAGESAAASDIARTCVFYAYTEDASNPDKSRKLGEILVVQGGNPKVPTAVALVETLADGTIVTYDQDNPMCLYVGNHKPYTLQLAAEAAESTTYRLYSDNPDAVYVYRDPAQDGLAYVQVKDGEDANLYVSFINNKETLEEVPKEYRYFVCKVGVPVYRAVTIGAAPYKSYDLANSPQNKNAEAFGNVLTNLGYSVEIKTDVSSAQDTYDNIKNTLSMADDNDISVVYLSAHGGINVLAMGEENKVNLATSNEYVATINGIKGTVVTIIEACHSGSFVKAIESADDDKRFFAMGACAESETTLYNYNATDIPGWFTRGIIDCINTENQASITLMIQYATRYISDQFANRDELDWRHSIILYLYYMENSEKYPGKFEEVFDQVYFDYFSEHDVKQLAESTFAPVWYCPPNSNFVINPQK